MKKMARSRRKYFDGDDYVIGVAKDYDSSAGGSHQRTAGVAISGPVAGHKRLASREIV